MALQTIWFILIAILFSGFFFLEGFDYGVGMLLPFLGKNDDERRVIINTIGPVWDGNEVWMITAGGAMFAAFPNWYATLFSGFYIALLLMLVALIVRAVAFEYRSKNDSPRWRGLWDWMIFFGSLVPALLWGVAMANLVKGVPIDANMIFVGNFFDLLSPFTLLSGLAAVAVFVLHGAIFLNLRTGEPIRSRAHNVAAKAWIVAVILSLLMVIVWYVAAWSNLNRVSPGTSFIVAGLALLISYWLIKQERMGWAFAMTGATIIFMTLGYFSYLYPNVMVSSLNPEWNLTIVNASSSQYTLGIMTIAALVFVPIVLIYQGWTYYRFWDRISLKSHLEY